MKIDIHATKPVRLRDLEEGDPFIQLRDYDNLPEEPTETIYLNFIRIRGASPLFAKTLLGTRVFAYPSDEVYRVSLYHEEGDIYHVNFNQGGEDAVTG